MAMRRGGWKKKIMLFAVACSKWVRLNKIIKPIPVWKTKVHFE
jgi:hypothetical protein